MIGWYLVPYKFGGLVFRGRPNRMVAMNDYNDLIFGDGGNWTETEVLGDRAIVKVRASDATLSILNGVYRRLPKDRLDDPLSDLPSQVLIRIRDELLDMGYSIEEIRDHLGDDLSIYTLRDVLHFMARRRLKPRWDGEKVVLDGIEQPCRPIESVDREVTE